jgi:fumarate hydratase subunit alpha
MANKNTELLYSLIKRAVTGMSPDFGHALRKAISKERNKRAKEQMLFLLKNASYAKRRGIPLCQDTGVPYFYARVADAKEANEIKKCAIAAVKRATRDGLLRPNIVDPITRKNKGNVGDSIPVFEFEFHNKNTAEIKFVPRGGGSENASRLGMLSPGESIEDFVLEKVKEVGGTPCPPYVLGIGIGGTGDLAMGLAKKASLRADAKNSDKMLKRMEESILRKINKTGIGPMGLGGDATCLAVGIKKADCHTASLPVALSFMCYPGRKASAKIRL